MIEEIPCGHDVTWSWPSVGQRGAFCFKCQRVYAVISSPPVPIMLQELDGKGTQ
jgi:hypothetical protein